jgi:hypothetical protein
VPLDNMLHQGNILRLVSLPRPGLGIRCIPAISRDREPPHTECVTARLHDHRCPEGHYVASSAAAPRASAIDTTFGGQSSDLGKVPAQSSLATSWWTDQMAVSRSGWEAGPHAWQSSFSRRELQ